MTRGGTPDPSRRRLLLAGTAGAGLVGAGAAGALLDRTVGPARDTATASPAAAAATAVGTASIPFHGTHQAGVETEPQAHASFLALDLRRGVDRDGVLRMLRVLTDDAVRLTAGRAPLAVVEPEMVTAPARLTVTAGFGPGLLHRAEREVPSWLAPLPAFSIDALQDEFCDGDLLLQVAADDPVTVSHAVRMLLKDARSFASLRWVQHGFRRAQGTQRPATTQRNLFGQLDGSANAALGSADFSRIVWIPDGPFAGGTTLVLRRIRMDLDRWDEVDRTAREEAVGRRLGSGAPLTGTAETDAADFTATTENGFSRIAEFAHMRRANGVDDGEHQEIFRRPFHYNVPPAAGSAEVSEAGQIFCSFQADIEGQFLPIQRRLAELDLLNQWTTPIGSAVFAIPPGCAEGEFLGQSVLE